AAWAVVHTVGLMVGGTLWRPEALSSTDLILPATEALAALLLIAVAARRPRARKPRGWLTALAFPPSLLLSAVLAVGGGLTAADDTWLASAGPWCGSPSGA